MFPDEATTDEATTDEAMCVGVMSHNSYPCPHLARELLSMSLSQWGSIVPVPIMMRTHEDPWDLCRTLDTVVQCALRGVRLQPKQTVRELSEAQPHPLRFFSLHAVLVGSGSAVTRACWLPWPPRPPMHLPSPPPPKPPKGRRDDNAGTCRKGVPAEVPHYPGLPHRVCPVSRLLQT